MGSSEVKPVYTGLIRDSDGHFIEGTRGGPGPTPAVTQFKEMLVACVSDADFEAIVGALIKKAKKGDVRAAECIFNRLLGKSPQALSIALEGVLLSGVVELDASS